MHVLQLNLKNWSNCKLLYTDCMMGKCLSLIDLNLSNFFTDNVINMSGMFYQCTSLKNLDLSSFKINNETNVTGMFSGCLESFKIGIRNKYESLGEDAFQNVFFEDA